MKNITKNIVLWIIVGLLLVALFNLFQGTTSNKSYTKISFSDFIIATDTGNVSEVNIRGNIIEGYFEDGRPFSTYSPNYPNLVDKLSSAGVKITAEPAGKSMHPILSVLLSWFPMLLLIGVWIFFMRQMQGGGGKAMGFGKSKAKLLNEAVDKVTFDDVAGIDEAKQELEEVVEFLKDQKKFSRLGGKIPKGALLIGPPGTGKTLLARAIAGEASVPFFSISGSDFVEMFVGVGASRVRDMFEQGKKNAPCIIFIDEIDAVGRHRGAGLGGGNDEREQTLNQLLVEMDGFETNAGVIIVAATNRPDVLDPALLRPGRFDRQVHVPLPDIIGREKILKVHMKQIKASKKIEARVIARGTPGFSGADLANLVNEAALLAARKNMKLVSAKELEDAKDKVWMGEERRSKVVTKEDLELTAYHEAGHATVSWMLEHANPLVKVTIVPRGKSLGAAWYLPEERSITTTEQLLDEMCSALGGRAAEELTFNKISTGALSDLEKVTKQAMAMVSIYGLNDKIGNISYYDSTNQGYGFTKPYSEYTARIIDEEIKILTDNQYARAKKILSENQDKLNLLAERLLKTEVIFKEDLEIIFGKRPFDNDSYDFELAKVSKPKAKKKSKTSAPPKKSSSKIKKDKSVLKS